MEIALNMRVSAAMLLLTLAVQGHNQPSNQPSELRSGQSSQGEGQNTSSQPVTQPSAQQAADQNAGQQMTAQSGAPGIPASSQSTEPKESFSQLTLLLFASGVALLIALLAWSDQIRGIDKDITELERRFLEDTGIEKRDFLRIVKPESPDDRGLALAQVVSAGRIKTKDSAEVLRIFTKWNKQWSRIVSLSASKYYVTIALTLVLFLGGVASLFTSPTQHVRLLSFQCRVEMVILILPATLVALLLIIIIWIAERENGLRSLLKSISEMV